MLPDELMAGVGVGGSRSSQNNNTDSCHSPCLASQKWLKMPYILDARQWKMKTELKAFFLLAQFHSARRSNTGWGGTARYPWSQLLRTLQWQYQPTREEVPTHAVVAWLLGGKWQSIISSEAHSTRIIPCLVLQTHVRAHGWGPLRPIWDN